MRAPQYGITVYKAQRRGRLNSLAPHAGAFKPYHIARPRSRLAPTRPNACPVNQRMIRHKLPAPFVDRHKVQRSLGISGANMPLALRRIRYLPPKQVRYSDGMLGAPCTMSLHHKNADLNLKARKRAFGSEYRRGPIVTKRYAVLETTHRGLRLSSSPR